MQQQRRSFLLARTTPTAIPRPPGAVSALEFEARCDSCARCAEACPSHVIKLRGRLAELDFGNGECTLCGRCSAACPSGALQPADPVSASIVARVGPLCLAMRGVECRSCGEHCSLRAIRFRPLPGRPWLPDIDAEACTGCGACLAPCPTGAIEFQPRTECFS